MSTINYEKNEVQCKVVYCGTKFSGKTTNLREIHYRTMDARRTELLGGTELCRTLGFEYLSYYQIGALKLRVTLCTVPGLVDERASRKSALRDVDGIIFVADSDSSRSGDNIVALAEMIEDLEEYRAALSDIPWVLQYNKRDLESAMPLDRMERELNQGRVRSIEACAAEGFGVWTSLNTVLSKLYARFSGRKVDP